MDGCIDCSSTTVLVEGLRQQVAGLKDTVLAQSRIIGQLKGARVPGKMAELVRTKQTIINTLESANAELRNTVFRLESALHGLNEAFLRARKVVGDE